MSYNLLYTKFSYEKYKNISQHHNQEEIPKLTLHVAGKCLQLSFKHKVEAQAVETKFNVKEILNTYKKFTECPHKSLNEIFTEFSEGLSQEWTHSLTLALTDLNVLLQKGFKDQEELRSFLKKHECVISTTALFDCIQELSSTCQKLASSDKVISANSSNSQKSDLLTKEVHNSTSSVTYLDPLTSSEQNSSQQIQNTKLTKTVITKKPKESFRNEIRRLKAENRALLKQQDRQTKKIQKLNEKLRYVSDLRVRMILREPIQVGRGLFGLTIKKE